MEGGSVSNLGGLFINRGHSGGRAFAAHRGGPKPDRAKLDAFAEALAEAGTVTGAAKACGISQQQGSKYLAKIRRGLGCQAQ
jgi:hypothetical protein